MGEEIQPGYYWAIVYYPFDNLNCLEIVEWKRTNEKWWEEGEEKEFEWMLCGSEVPVFPHDRIKLLPNDGPLKPPTIPAESIEAIDPHPAAVEMIHHIEPIRDNGKD